MAAALSTTLPAQNSVIFAGNLPDLDFYGINPDDGMVFSITFNMFPWPAKVLIDETIWPDANYKATIKIRAVVEASLEHLLPTTDSFKQTKALATMTISYDGITYVLYVIKGGLFIPETLFGTFDYNTFTTSNLLNWMPADRNVKYREPNFINYFNRSAGAQLYAKAYYISGTSVLYQEYAIYSAMDQNALYTFNVAFNTLIVQTGETRGAIAFDLYIKAGANKLSNTQRFTLINDFDEYDDVFSYSNSLGGFETIRFTGLLAELEQHSPLVFRNNNNHFIEYENIPERVFKKFTGYFNTDAYRKWVRDFFTSAYRFHLRIVDSVFVHERITLISQSAEGSRFNPNSYEFQFKYANQVQWQFNTRDELFPINPADAVIPANIGDLPENFFNEDFLNETPLTQISDELLNT